MSSSFVAFITCDYCGLEEETTGDQEYGADLPDGWTHQQDGHRDVCPACRERVLAHTRRCVKVREPTDLERARVAMTNQLLRQVYTTDPNCRRDTVYAVPSVMLAWMPKPGA